MSRGDFPELRDALLRAIYEGALCLRFLPIVSLGTGVRRVKTEIAWQHRDFGWLDSAAICRVARSAAAMTVIDDWVFARVTALAQAWQKEPAMDQITFVIPLSHRDVASPDDCKRFLATRADATSLSPGFEFEVGRRAVSGVLHVDNDAFSRVHSVSSNIFLSKDPADDEAPIDGNGISARAFQIDVSAHGSSADARDLVRQCEMAVETARRCNMEVIASGVDVFGMLASVADTGVDAVQGAITGGAMSLGELEDYVTTRNLNTIVDLQASMAAMQAPG